MDVSSYNAALVWALYLASSLVMTPLLMSSWRHWSSVCMPAAWPVWIAEYIWAILPSRIWFRIAGVPIMISWAAIRPPPTFFNKVWEMTARSDSDNIERTISFSAAGNTSTIRSMVFAAELVCRVPNTRWPVSAADSARRMVSRSRISPTRTMSGSSRKAERKASAKPRVSRWTSRWFTSERLDSWTNSIGSSRVRMWSGRLSLAWLTMPASVVDLPEPVGPVTRTRPRGNMHRSRKILGEPRSSRDMMTEGILRNTAPAPRFWMKALTRKRASLGISNEKSVSKNSSYALRCLSFMMSYTMLCTSLWASAGMLIRFMSPSTRIMGGTPADRCRSDALFLTANAKSCAMSTAMEAPREGPEAGDTASDALNLHLSVCVVFWWGSVFF